MGTCDGLAEQIAFKNASNKIGSPATGADYIMVIKGYEEITFMVRTHSVPVIKNGEVIEYSSTHGVKQEGMGYVQTHNILPVTLMDDLNNEMSKAINKMILNREDDLEVLYFKGRTIKDMVYIGRLTNSFFTRDEPTEGDNEATTAPSQLTLELHGDFLPAECEDNKEEIKDVLSGLI